MGDHNPAARTRDTNHLAERLYRIGQCLQHRSVRTPARSHRRTTAHAPRRPVEGRRVTLSGFAGTAHRPGNGLACGAAAGPLHPAADRPLSRPCGQIPRRSVAASRALRGPSDRPAAALDPTAAAAGCAYAPPLGGRQHAARPRPRRDSCRIFLLPRVSSDANTRWAAYEQQESLTPPPSTWCSVARRSRGRVVKHATRSRAAVCVCLS
jgi:hypothetical protein